MRMLLLDVENNKVEIVQASELEDYYKFIGCRCIDIVRRKIGEKYYNIICDDEGVLIDKPKPSGISITGEVMLCGNLLVAGDKVTEDGELTEITYDGINHIIKNIWDITTSVHTTPYNVFVEMDY